MAEQKSCFIIMPITTPEPVRELYRDSQDHFRHVLQCLFKPGVEKAGYKPIPPTAKGSDLIHAQIIKNLETADLVLCDMSCLNPNVFFEFGIRTSLNKPVCVVKDELTEKVPFDTVMLNYQEYKSTLEPWELGAEITKLAEHVKASAERSIGENTLWRYFGLKSEAAPYKGETGTDAKLDYLTLQVESLKQRFDTYGQSGIFAPVPAAETKPHTDSLSDFLYQVIPEGADVRSVFHRGNGCEVMHVGEIDFAQQVWIAAMAREQFDVEVSFKRLDTDSEEQNEEK